MKSLKRTRKSGLQSYCSLQTTWAALQPMHVLVNHTQTRYPVRHALDSRQQAGSERSHVSSITGQTRATTGERLWRLRESGPIWAKLLVRSATPLLIHSSIALPPVVELARGYAQPRHESSDSERGLLRPAPLGQDLVLGLHFLLQELNPFLFFLHLAARTLRRLEGGRSVLEELLLPAVQNGGLQPQFFTQIGN